MKVKKYIAKTMPEAMQSIKKELGPNAVILQSKEVKKGGFLGFFKNKRIEVIAALDNMPLPEERTEEQPIRTSRPKQTAMNQDKVLDEINQLKQLLQDQAFVSDSNYPPLFEWTYQYLLKQEVEQSIAKDVMDKIISIDNEITDKPEMKQVLNGVLDEMLDTVLFETPKLTKQIIQFVGPTGVGKTTTLAKTAAQFMLKHKKKVAFITMDTYRIAAIEQLKTYARILDVPVEVAYSIKDYQQALKRFSDYDLIFVDTAGRNFRNPQYVNEMKQMIEIEHLNVETYLVLSLTAKKQDIQEIYSQFEPINIKKVIFSKADETSTYGSMLNICVQEKASILYITNGQNVPDDLLEPSKDLMIKLLLSRYDDE